MKKILRYTFFAMALAAMTSCSDQFLQDKKDYNGFNEEIYDNIALATGKVDFVYGFVCLQRHRELVILTLVQDVPMLSLNRQKNTQVLLLLRNWLRF